MDEKIILNVFAERLSNLIKSNDIDILKFTSDLGLKSKTTIYRYMKGEMSPKLTTIKVMSDILNVNPVWLMGYDVPMTKPPTVDNNVSPVFDKVISIPVIGKISAGLPILATENIIDYAFAPSSQIKSNFQYFYLVVQGDSMDRKFHEGDIILVQKQDFLENDEIGVIMIDDEATVKRYKSEDGLVTLYPMSTNPIHDAQTYNPRKRNIKIIGKVLSYQGKV